MQRKIQADQLDPSINLGGGGEGTVVGPATSTDNAIARFDGTTGDLVQNSAVTIADNGFLSSSAAAEFNAVLTDSVSERNAAAGVTIDGVLVKDGNINRTDGLSLSVYSTGEIAMQPGTGFVVEAPGIAGISADSFDVNANTATVNGASIVTTTATQTLTNKRIVPRVNGLSGTSGSFSPLVNMFEMEVLQAQGAITIETPALTPEATVADGRKYLLRLKDNGTARTLTWNAIYRPISKSLPTSTVVGKTMYIGMIYNASDIKWDVVMIEIEA